MALKQEVIDRLLLAKLLLGQIQYTPVAGPDRFTIARYILIAHDAAELAIAGIAHHLDCLPPPSEAYLMKYFPRIKEKTNESVPGQDFFSDLNDARRNIKHKAIFLDTKQWYRVGENTYNHISELCKKYLKISLDLLDESVLLKNDKARQLFVEAQKEQEDKHFKQVLEKLALALHIVFKDNLALRKMSVGQSRAEDAIKLAAFGVHTNDFLALQEFLPSIVETTVGEPKIMWKQAPYGHPANWTLDTVEFCLRTFIHVAVRIQDAEWIPGAILWFYIYEHKVTALEDGVKIVQEYRTNLLDFPQRHIIKELNKGESIIGSVRKESNSYLSSVFAVPQKPDVITFSNREIIGGEIEMNKVRVTCVPRDNELIRKYYPDLTEIDWEPGD